MTKDANASFPRHLGSLAGYSLVIKTKAMFLGSLVPLCETTRKRTVRDTHGKPGSQFQTLGLCDVGKPAA